MSVCALVVERVKISENNHISQKVARIIIGIQDDSDTITLMNKYVFYPRSDVFQDDWCYRYNGIDANTIAKRGERYSAVIDWMRAAICGRRVVVCGTADIQELIGDTVCQIVDLQKFFHTQKSHNISEPIGLVRLAFKFFGYSPAVSGRRDPFEECRIKIGMWHVMNGLKACGKVPPFEDTAFPKVPRFGSEAPRDGEDSQTDASEHRYETMADLHTYTNVCSCSKSSQTTITEEDDESEIWFDSQPEEEEEKEKEEELKKGRAAAAAALSESTRRPACGRGTCTAMRNQPKLVCFDRSYPNKYNLRRDRGQQQIKEPVKKRSSFLFRALAACVINKHGN